MASAAIFLTRLERGYKHKWRLTRMAVLIAREIELDDANLYILTPYPGTKIYEQFKREGRLLEGKGRHNFGWANAVFKPKNMTPEELEAGVQGAIQELSGYFRDKLPLRFAERFTWIFRHPRMMLAMAAGGFAKRDISRPIAPDPVQSVKS